jgi:hypothetical protein
LIDELDVSEAGSWEDKYQLEWIRAKEIKCINEGSECVLFEEGIEPCDIK